jgi:predicted subunit of tRNA(5-methylaminomethyl-2-thiouridylate) methyltransferase
MWGVIALTRNLLRRRIHAALSRSRPSPAYEQARQRAVEIMAASVPRGSPTWRRDELHER